MRRKLAITAILCVVAAAGFGSIRRRTPSRSGTACTPAEQGKRGEASYQDKCASCHGPDLSVVKWPPP